MVQKIILWNILVLIVHMTPLHSISITITPEELYDLGQKIWHNECNGTIEGLTTWNEGEEFASLGIGHFIWYPVGKKQSFIETFPSLISYMELHGKIVPSWLKNSIKKGCPWKTRPLFLNAQKSKRMLDLRTFLKNSIALQTQYIIDRFITLTQSELMQKKITHKAYANLYAMAQTPQGRYALIDYVNFKGDGLTEAPSEYGSKGWGLLQVLEKMDTPSPKINTFEAFVRAAKAVLTQRVKHAPPQRNEERWIPGWFKRLDSYLAT